MLKRILAGVCDPQYTIPVSFYARELALRFQAEVTAIAVTDIQRLRNVGSVAIGAGAFAKELVQDRIEHNQSAVRQSLEILTSRLAEAKVPCHVVEVSGSPYEAMLDASRYHDLMIFGLRGLFEHGVLDEPPMELVRLVEAGVRPILATGPDFQEIQRVLVAYSGSIESAKTVRNFAHLNLWPNAKVKVVHFGSPPHDAQSLLSDIESYLRVQGFETEAEFVEGSAKTGLLPHAEAWNADMIVVGNSSKSLLMRRVFGETALNTIRESRLPLFLSQ